MGTFNTLVTTALLVGLVSVLSCGDSDDGSPDPLGGIFQEGVYTRFDGEKNYEIRFGVSIGRFVLLVDGVEQRRGTHTLATTKDGDPALGIIDDGQFPARCPEDQQLSAYVWEIKDNKLSLDPFEEPCEQRKSELDSDDWLYQGPAPTSTPVRAPTATP
jgi:hypothetical protein